MSTLNEYLENPVLWEKEILDDIERWDKQKEIIESVAKNRKTFVKSAHGVGKTFSAKDVVMWFLYTHCPSIVITTAPSWTQVEKLLWAEINSAFQNSKTKLGGVCNDTELRLDSKWFAIGMSPKLEGGDAGRMTGFHSDNILIVLDEAPSIDPRIWEIVETMMTSDNVKLLAIGNPIFDHGHFFDGFRDSSISKISISIFDNPNFKENNIKSVEDLEQIARMEATDREKYFLSLKTPFKALTGVRWAVDRLIKWGKSSPIFISRVLGDFPTQSIDTIIPLGILENAKEADGSVKGISMGVDVARFGSDNTTFYIFQNGVQIYKEVYNGQDLVYTANTIFGLSKKFDVRIVVLDDTGLGGGVTDIINNDDEHKFMLLPINFAEKAIDIETYDGIVTEMYFHAKKMIEGGTVEVKDEGELFSQLSNRKYKYTNKGLIKIESKDDYKKRTGGVSPDEADAFVMALWGYTSSEEIEVSSRDGSVTGKMYE